MRRPASGLSQGAAKPSNCGVGRSTGVAAAAAAAAAMPPGATVTRDPDVTVLLKGWHGRRDGHPHDSPDLYLTPDQAAADGWADGKDVYWVEVAVRNPLHLRAAQEFRAVWEAAGCDRCEGVFHPTTTRRFTGWLRDRGYDAVVMHSEMFDTDEQENWELVAGTFGDPQTIILNPQRASAQLLGAQRNTRGT